MSEEQSAEEEPSIEEILDSIRQIISDDDEAEETAPEEAEAEAEAPEPEAEPEPEPEAEPEEEIIELTDIVEDETEEEPENVEIDLMDAAPEEAEDDTAEEEPQPMPEEAATAEAEEPQENISVDFGNDDDVLDSIISNNSAEITAGAFAELAQKAAIDKSGTVTVEDIVRAEIRPILRTWVDQHLPSMMERLLQEELEKIAKRAMEE